MEQFESNQGQERRRDSGEGGVGGQGGRGGGAGRGGGGEGGRGGGGEGGRGWGGHGCGRSHAGRGGGGGHGRGPWSRARRGDVRVAILLALADEPMHGYQIMQRLEERSGGAWRPSPGSVYPTLQLLEDQGLVKGEEAEGRRVFSLTEAGIAEAEALKDRMSDAPWGEGNQDPRFALKHAVISLGAAAKQVGMAGSADDVQKALDILREARKRVYGLLADAE